MKNPNISIVTVSKNSAHTIRDTITSVAKQEYTNLEHWIIDGASTDNTVAIIQNYRNNRLKILVEEDAGIADAMNKGINRAKGEWLLFLNSDDCLLSENTLSEVAPYLTEDFDIVGFPVLFGSQPTLKRPRGASWYLNFKTGLMHQGTFIRKGLFDSISYYDTNFRITMDYEFFLRAYKQGARFSTHRTPPVAIMGDAGISSQKDWGNLSQRLAEERLVQKKNSTGVIRSVQSLYWMLYPLYRYLRQIFSR